MCALGGLFVFSLLLGCNSEGRYVELVDIPSLTDSVEAVLIDVRDSKFYNEGHICGSHSMPYKYGRLDSSVLELVENAEKPIVVYADERSCNWARETARMIAASTKRTVYYHTIENQAWIENDQFCP